MPNPTKPNRRKQDARKLEPIDWHEFANDAVLNGNMSTLFHRPPTEDPTAYASPEALVEIGKRTGRAPGAPPTAGAEPTVSAPPSAGAQPAAAQPAAAEPAATLRTVPTIPIAGPEKPRKVKPIRKLQDALTLAGQVLYQAMYGGGEGSGPRECAKGYRQLAAETHLDKDTVRDLIADFKARGILREIGTYNADTRSSKTYEVLSGSAIVQKWRDSGLCYVTSGRQRPEFCTAQGVALQIV